MKPGRKICNTLKEIRQRIADANDIAYSPNECHHEGDCAGTCPVCESEMRYLENELTKRQRMGRAIMVAGLGAGLAGLVSLSSCNMCTRTAGAVANPDTLSQITCDSSVAQTDTALLQNLKNDTDVITRRTEGMVARPRASFPGGHEAMMNYINDHLVYPADARKESVQGNVIVTFVVKPNGEHVDHAVVRGIDPRLDAEALRVVKSLPRFNELKNGNYDTPETVTVSFSLD